MDKNSKKTIDLFEIFSEYSTNELEEKKSQSKTKDERKFYTKILDIKLQLAQEKLLNMDLL
ncbi:MAG: hypothetical protein FWH48_03550 [Oscillospiraceae bacterium]|nr:hypothetical protein [Oscillospiraceae bacterium]